MVVASYFPYFSSLSPVDVYILLQNKTTLTRMDYLDEGREKEKKKKTDEKMVVVVFR